MATVDRRLFKPLPSKRAFEEIADQIKRLIYSRKFRPGDKLPPERELAVQFGSSRTAVREAFRMLEQSGLIYMRHGSDGGAFVKEADTSVVIESISDLIRRGNLTIENLRQARAGIDKLIMEAAVKRVTEEEIEALEGCIEESERILRRKPQAKPPFDFEKLVGTFRRFHFILAKATKNPFFEVIVEAVMDTTRFVVNEKTTSHHRLKSHLVLHRGLYEAVKSRDLSLVLRTIDEHGVMVENNWPSKR